MNSLKYNDCRPRIGPIFCFSFGRSINSMEYQLPRTDLFSLCESPFSVLFEEGLHIFLEVKITLLVLKTTSSKKYFYCCLYSYFVKNNFFYFSCHVIFPGGSYTGHNIFTGKHLSDLEAHLIQWHILCSSCIIR